MPRERFKQFVKATEPAEPLLPLTHLTDAYRFENARRNDSLEPQLCPVFNEPLLYFFYGRPAYRVHSDELPSGLDHYLPVCIIFRNKDFPLPKRMFPFDSGAFSTGRYADALHSDMGLEDFSLEVHPTTPGKIISLFFGSVGAYCLANPAVSTSIPVTQFEARSYAALVTSRLRSNTDDRGSAIELQIDSPFKMSKYAEALVAPGPLLDDPDISAFLKENNIEQLPYEQINHHRPAEFMANIFSICQEYYRRRGLLPPVR